jgi:type I restriction enzyme M protein
MFASAEGKNGGQWSGATWTTIGSPEGWRGGANQFYTPSCVVRCLVEMLAPNTALRGSAYLQSEATPQVVSAAKDKGRIYDPACGSGGMFASLRPPCGMRFARRKRASARGIVQSEKFVESHGDKLGDISIYGQDKWARRQRPFGLAKRARRVRLRGQQPKQSNATTRRLAIMNLAIRGIEADIGKEHADTFRNVQHPDLRADYVLANPPFNDSDTALRACALPESEATMQVVSEAKDKFRKDDDVRWQWSGATWTTRQGCPEGERGGVHQFSVPPKTARREGANTKPEGTPQVVSEARDNNANFAWEQHFIHYLAPQTALRDSAFNQREASPQVVSKAKDNMAGFVLANGSMSSNQSGEWENPGRTPRRKSGLDPLLFLN